MNTRQKILDKALELFNERGIEYVGVRELAAILGIRVGNITYYFATKDDLVYELSQMLRDSNSGLIVPKDSLTASEFLESLQQVFLNHVKFRCLLLSFVHVMKQNPLMAEGYRQTQQLRTNTLEHNIRALVFAGYLEIEDHDLGFLVSGISLISRFWISEAAVSMADWSVERQISHYLKLTAKLLMPYATAKGKDDIEEFLLRI